MQPLKHHSFANLDHVTYKHLQWNITIDFERQQLVGSAEYTVSCAKNDKNRVLVLDTNHLNILKTFVDDKQVEFTLEDSHPVFGRALVIPLKSGNAKKVRVEYSTTDKSVGLQWLPKEQTADKTHPYLFTQCQAIHARTIVPSPDTPACKFTYAAQVTVPEWCTPLLSAIADEAKPVTTNGNQQTFAFRQDVPIPSYLLAIAAGRLDSREIGPRSRVWAEPSVVERAAYEFEETEQFLQAAEEITGQEYVWKRYDLVCLPPSFPYGGMENPCLTFVTPTLLAGDRSLADVVAHEISHSWTGNLVTNRSWKDFWLNEGWTMWLERKIMTRMYNDPLMYDLKATIGHRALVEAVKGFGCTHPFTHLVPESDEVDPDDVFSSIPYEKGFNFLHYLTQVVGGHDVFEDFAKAYIKNFRYKNLSSDDFKHFFIDYFTKTVDKREAIKQIEWDTWFYTPGMPPVPSRFDTTHTAQAIQLGERMAASQDATKWGMVEMQAWPCTLWVLLLDTLLLQQEKGANFTPAHLDAIDAFCNHQFTQTQNAELRFRWFTLSLRAKDTRLVANAVAFLEEQGRMKYVRPLFRDLCCAAGHAHASDVFARTQSLYHPIAAKMIQRDLEQYYQKQASATKIAKSGGCPLNFTTYWGCGCPFSSLKDLNWAMVAAGVGAVALTAVVLSKRR